MRILVPTAVACMTILMLLFFMKLHALQVTYVTYLDIAEIATAYCTAVSNNYQDFARCIKLIEPGLVPVAFQDCSRCVIQYNLKICYTCHIGVAKAGSEMSNATTYIAPTYVDARRIIIRKGKLAQTLYNITIVAVSDTCTSLLLPRNCTYIITGGGYIIRCLLPKIENIEICDVRGLCVEVKTLG